MKMGFRLMVLVGMMGVLLLIVGATGVRGMSQIVSGLETVYKNRVLPLRDFKNIADGIRLILLTPPFRFVTATWGGTTGASA